MSAARLALCAAIAALVSSNLSGRAMRISDERSQNIEDRREQCLGLVELDFQALEDDARWRSE
jgi:hypothetical protein